MQPSEAVSASLLSAGGAGPGADGEVASAIPQNVSFPQSVRESVLRGTENVERAMSKPLGAIARIFEQLEETANDLTGQQQQQGSPSSPSSGSMRVPPAPYPPTPGAQGHPGADGYVGPPARPGVTKRRSYHGGPGLSPPHRPPLLPLPSSTGSLQHAAPPPDWAMYAAPETSDAAVLEEIDRQHEEARQAQLGTLESIFPDAEREVLEMVSRTIHSLGRNRRQHADLHFSGALTGSLEQLGRHGQDDRFYARDGVGALAFACLLALYALLVSK